MRRSIRGILFFWYAVILVLVIVAYGATLIESQRRSMYASLDSRLDVHAIALAGSVEDEVDGFELEISPQYYSLFKSNDPDSPYFVFWDRHGSIAATAPPGLLVTRAAESGIRDRDGNREVSRRGHDGTWVLVGQATDRVREDLGAFTGKVAGIGVTVLIISLLGGWFLAGRVLKPIRRISEAASEISESNLSRRINLKRTENELGGLAGVLNEAFDRLQSAVERQKRFTADASHELRTPLSVILVHTEHSLSRKREAAEYEEALQAIDRAANRMKSLIGVLLGMARADSGNGTIFRESIDLEKVVDETIDLLRPMAEARGVVLDRATVPAKMQGNRELLQEMAINLISNSIIHNRRGGRSRACLRVDNGAVVFRVEDDGPGIPEDDLPHLFERFYRVDKARSRRTGGSGLGLAITKWIVEEHGGSISVESDPGKGSVFSVRLPATPTAQPPHP
ncbi:MAG: ATP-binding protein [Planctomycetota bacterium]|nr:ATP-binding protein [Planctomycetota bacterium]